MSEHNVIFAHGAHGPDECATHDGPVWEVQGYGTVTGASQEQDGAVRREILPPWVDVRLTFPDGARIDVLAVVRDGRMAIEDAQADPPLALADFAALAEVIDAPLQDAWQVVADRHRPADRELESAPLPTSLPVSPQPPLLVSPQPQPQSPVTETSTVERAVVRPPAEVPAVVRPPADEPQREEPAGREPHGDGPTADEHVGQDEHVDPSGRHRARATPPRGPAGRIGAAEVYRAAQRDGVDPVLAVMAATGLNRRKSLRLIAGARDDGHLSPRHNRR